MEVHKVYLENLGRSEEEGVTNGRNHIPNKNGNTIGLDEEKEGEEFVSLATRALFLLSFKDTDTQNLRYVLNVLGIRTVDEKRSILQVIFRLIREGIVYVPKGLPLLVDIGSQISTNNDREVDNINLCLLRPYSQIIKELQDDIAKMKEKSM